LNSLEAFRNGFVPVLVPASPAKTAAAQRKPEPIKLKGWAAVMANPTAFIILFVASIIISAGVVFAVVRRRFSMTSNDASKVKFGIASATIAVVIGYVAAGTKSIRVGAAGNTFGLKSRRREGMGKGNDIAPVASNPPQFCFNGVSLRSASL
jgi:hypothetical protein